MVDNRPFAGHASVHHRTLLWRLLARYARLMVKADHGRLNSEDLGQVFVTAIDIRKGAWELGVTNLQLELMLEETIRHVGTSKHA